MRKTSLSIRTAPLFLAASLILTTEALATSVPAGTFQCGQPLLDDAKTKEILRRGDPTFGQLLAVFLVLENPIVAYSGSNRLALSGAELRRIDSDYDPFANGDLDGYEDLVDHFMGAHNATVFAAIKADIDKETGALLIAHRGQGCLY